MFSTKDHFIWIIPALLAGGPVLAQQDLRLPGVAVEQNSRYRTGELNYVEGVFILAGGATPARSDVQGRFTLIFADKPSGDLVRITARKAGFVVVNDREIETASVLGRRQPLRVVLCDEKRLQENQLAYYRIAEDIARKALEKKMAQLQNDITSRDEVIAALEQELNRRIDTEEQLVAVLEELQLVQQVKAEAVASRLLIVNLDDAGEAYRRAYEAFLAGQADQAIAILDSLDTPAALEALGVALEEERTAITALQESIARKEAQKQQLLEQLVFKARLLSLELRFGEAEENYLLALQHDSLHVELLWELAQFHAGLNHYQKAVNYADRALALPTSDRERAGLLNIRGVVRMKQQRAKEALSAFEEALSVYRQLIREDSLRHLPELAMLLENIGHLHYRAHRLNEAGAHYEQAIAIWETLIEQQPEKAYSAAASALNALGMVYRDAGQPQQADTLLRQSLHIYRLLQAKVPYRYEPDMATTLGNLALLYSEQGAYDSASAWYAECLDSWRRLSAGNPDAYLPILALNLQNAALLSAKMKHYAKADSTLAEAQGIFSHLEKNSPGVYAPDLANVLNIRGVVCEESGRPEKALMYYQQSLDLRKQLALNDPETFEEDLWTSYLNVIALYKNRLLISGDTTHRSDGLRYLDTLDLRLQAAPTLASDPRPLVRRMVADVEYYRYFFDHASPAFLRKEAALQRANELESEAGKAASPLRAAALQEEVVAVLRNILREMPGDSALVLRLGQALGGVATYQLFSGAFDSVPQSVSEALLLAPSETWLHIPLATALVFIGQFGKADAIYREWMDKPYHGDTTFRTIFLRDLDHLAKNGFTHPDTAKAKKLLNGE